MWEEKEKSESWEREWLKKTGRDYPPGVKELADKLGMTVEQYREAMKKIGTPVWSAGAVAMAPKTIPAPVTTTVTVDVTIIKENNNYKGCITIWGGRFLAPKEWRNITSKLLKPFSPGQVVEGVVDVVNGKMTLKSVELRAVESTQPSVEPKEIEEMTTATTTSVLDGFYINDESRSVFNTVWKLSQTYPEVPQKVMIKGPSGYGKTALPFLFSQVAGLDYYRMNCANVRDPEEWFGFREARGGETVFIPSRFIELVTKGNVVIVLDEFNRIEPWLHNTLYPLLDDDAKTVVHDQEFKVGPGTIFVGTINTGWKYTGTFELDEALYNRFPFVLEMGPPPHAEEVSVLVKRTGIEFKTAQAVVKLANILRQSNVGCSTRSTLLISQQINAGMSLREAFEYSVVKRTPDDGKRKEVLDLINTNAGHHTPRKWPDDIFLAAGSASVTGEEPKESVRVPAFTFSKKEGASFNAVAFQQLLKKLPLEKTCSASEAADLAELIEKGIPVVVQMSREFTSEDPLVAEIRKVGMTARYHKTEQKERGVAQ